jgi:hypothetical protein
MEDKLKLEAVIMSLKRIIRKEEELFESLKMVRPDLITSEDEANLKTLRKQLKEAEDSYESL